MPKRRTKQKFKSLEKITQQAKRRQMIIDRYNEIEQYKEEEVYKTKTFKTRTGEEVKIRPYAFRVLETIKETGIISPKELRKLLKTPPGTVRNALTSLRKAGLLPYEKARMPLGVQTVSYIPTKRAAHLTTSELKILTFIERGIYDKGKIAKEVGTSKKMVSDTFRKLRRELGMDLPKYSQRRKSK